MSSCTELGLSCDKFGLSCDKLYVSGTDQEWGSLRGCKIENGNAKKKYGIIVIVGRKKEEE